MYNAELGPSSVPSPANFNDGQHELNYRHIVQHFYAYLSIKKLPIEEIWSVQGIHELHLKLTYGLENADPGSSVIPGEYRTDARRATGVGNQ